MADRKNLHLPGNFNDPATEPVFRIPMDQARLAIVHAIATMSEDVFDWFVAGMMVTSNEVQRLPSHVREEAESLTNLVLVYAERKERRRNSVMKARPTRGGG